MLEWYRPGDYKTIMEDVAHLFVRLSDLDFLQNPPGFSLKNGVKRSSVQSCFQQYAGLDLLQGLKDETYWRRTAAEVLEEQLPTDDTFEDIFFRIWLKFIEPQLGQQQPEIVYDYPASMAALSRLKEPERIWAERFEVYVHGIELGNAFSELIDAHELETRYRTANRERESRGYPPHPFDRELIEAVQHMQPTGGIAIGVERLLMVLTGESDIRQFFLLPENLS
jgi:lysyl-tRNA synthetase class 2